MGRPDLARRDELDAELRRRIAECLRDVPPDTTPDRLVREARFDAGLAFVSFPEGLGGLGLDPALQSLVDEEFRAAGCPDWTDRNVIGLGMAAPTIAQHGSTDQQRLLRPLYTGEHIWCQLFSEPGAGSDLADVATRARAADDGWRISGQKVWTSLGHIARYGILLARTDPAVPKHRGLTYFVLDMQLPGVEVRPLRQLTGEAEFNEVFLDDVLVPDAARVGAVGDGWRVAMTTLANERNTLGTASDPTAHGPLAQLVDVWRARPSDEARATDLEVARLWCRAQAAAHLNEVVRTRVGNGEGAWGSAAKLLMAEINQAASELAVDLLGDDVLWVESYEMTQPAHTTVHGSPDLRMSFLRSLANSIEGGTSEIQRNLLGERVLGLEPEPRTDKTEPWNASRRG